MVMATTMIQPLPVLPEAVPQVRPDQVIAAGKSQETVLAQRSFSLNYRYPVPSVSNIFKDNILLALAYIDGRVKNTKDINWDQIEQPFDSKITLQPGQTFAFHDKVLPQYQGKVALTGNSNFGASDGYKTDGYLYGDGVCHLASFISWVAKDAHLDVLAPTRHDFAAIPEVPKEQGVSIYYDPNDSAHSERSNLYITNNMDKTVSFVFHYGDDGELTIKAVEE